MREQKGLKEEEITTKKLKRGFMTDHYVFFSHIFMIIVKKTKKKGFVLKIFQLISPKGSLDNRGTKDFIKNMRKNTLKECDTKGHHRYWSGDFSLDNKLRKSGLFCLCSHMYRSSCCFYDVNFSFVRKLNF